MTISNHVTDMSEHRIDNSRQNVLPWPGLETTFRRIERTPHATDRLWYLMSPYTRYEAGQSVAWQHATRIAASLTVAGLIVYSPILHGHPLSRASRSVPLAQDFWDRINLPFMDAAVGALLAELPGWDESEGISREVTFFEQSHKPVIRLPIPEALLVG